MSMTGFLKARCVSTHYPGDSIFTPTHVGAFALKAAVAAVWLLDRALGLHHRTVVPKLAIWNLISAQGFKTKRSISAVRARSQEIHCLWHWPGRHNCREDCRLFACR